MSESLHEALQSLPSSSLTTRLLSTLDFVVPGEWKNITAFDAMIKEVTGETDEALIQQIGAKALELYADEANGYQRALSIYRAVDKASMAAGMATLAAKAGEGGGFFGNILATLTPKAETTQALDAVAKLVAELAAFCSLNGLPGDSVGDFAKALIAAEKEDKMRLASWVVCDCMLPLGPDFVQKLSGAIDSAANSSAFQTVTQWLPAGAADKAGLVKAALSAASGSAGTLVASSGLTPAAIADKLKSLVDGAEGKMDVMAAIIDTTTSVFAHTGTQTVARRVITRAYNEL
jgi:hypothetical protein